MRISIIVPAYNEERLLGASLSAIRRAAEVFSDHGWDRELIVCDNNSSDATAQIARDAGATVVFEPVNQIGRARNAGAAAATGDWLLFIDADSRPCRDLFEAVVERIRSGRVLAGGATLVMDDGSALGAWICRLWNLTSRCLGLFAGSFIFVETAAFREVGGFSHDWFAGEELDLCRRLRRHARAARKRIVILHRHPLHTSGRKISLYSPWEMLRLIAAALFSGGRSLRRRESTLLWYDGRR